MTVSMWSLKKKEKGALRRLNWTFSFSFPIHLYRLYMTRGGGPKGKCMASPSIGPSHLSIRQRATRYIYIYECVMAVVLAAQLLSFIDTSTHTSTSNSVPTGQSPAEMRSAQRSAFWMDGNRKQTENISRGRIQKKKKKKEKGHFHQLLCRLCPLLQQFLIIFDTIKGQQKKEK